MKKLFVVFALIFSTQIILNADVKEVFIYVDQSDWDYIYENWEEEIYVPCSVKYESQEWTECEMRFRGDGSKKFWKKSLKVKFLDEMFYNGKRKLNLNVDYIDSSRIRNYLAAYVFRKSGAPTFEAEHYRVYLNDEYSGLYISVENMDEQFLEARGLNPNNNLYKAAFDGSCMHYNDDISKWEKKTNELGDWNDLKELIIDVNNCKTEDFDDFAKDNFDYDNLVNYIALSMMITNASTYYHNYYLYNNTEMGKWQIIAWDMDKTFSCYGAYYHYRRISDIWFHDNPLYMKAVANETMYDDIMDRVDELSETLVNQEVLNPILDSLSDVLKSSVFEDSLFQIRTDEAWDRQYQKEKDYLRDKHNVIYSYIERYPTIFENTSPDSIEFEKVDISWKAAENQHDEGDVRYNVYYGAKPDYNNDGDVKITDYSQTSYTISDIDDGKYYYRIDAYNTSNNEQMKGFDKYNKFMFVKEPTKLPSEISSKYTLSKSKSPYLLDTELHLTSSGSLVFEPGAELYISQKDGHNIEGTFTAIGTSDKPVKIYSKYDLDLVTLTFNHAKDINIENAKIKNVILHTYDTDITMKNSYYKFIAWIDKHTLIDVIDVDGKNTVAEFDGIRFDGHSEVEAFMIRDYADLSIKNCFINNCAEGIEFFQPTGSSIIANNIIWGSHDDAIDLNGCHDAIVEDNLIVNAADKAISLDGYPWQNDPEVILRRNVIYNAGTAIAIKDNLHAIIENNTIVGSRTGIDIYIKENDPELTIPPTMETINTIFYDVDKIVNYGDQCTGSISYSLSNDEVIEGSNNIIGDPLFENADLFDFSIKASSPCVDAGDPNSTKDEDGTISDIGAIPFFQDDSNKFNVVINEINYHSPDDYDSGDWVEFYNNSNVSIDLDGWYFSDSDDAHKFEFPNMDIDRHEYLVLYNDKNLYRNINSDKNPSVGEFDFGLSGSGEIIRLYNKSNDLIDWVEYDDVEPWNPEADGNGKTLELISPTLDNAIAKNWGASKDNGGSPCAQNSNCNDSVEQNIVFDLNLYPNPCEDNINLKIEDEQMHTISYSIIDIKGRTFLKGNSIMKLSGESYSDLINIDVADLNMGVYYLKVNLSSDESESSGIVLIPFIKE